jgi:hypothetical protein
MAKANRLRDEVIASLLELYPELDEWDIQYPANSAPGEDLLFSPKAEKLIGLSFELKNQEQLGIWGAIKQAISNCKDRVPVVVFRKNRTKAWIAMPFEYWLQREKSRLPRGLLRAAAIKEKCDEEWSPPGPASPEIQKARTKGWI